VAKGQHFHQPYFGCREFVAEIIPADGPFDVISDTRDLGLMLWDIVYGKKSNRPVFFPARLTGGVLEVPPQPEALAMLAGAGKAGAP